MSKTLFAVCCLLVIVLHQANAVSTSEDCQYSAYANRKHCVIEAQSVSRYPNTVRYTYIWSRKKCVPMNWWTDVARCSLTVDYSKNNFDTIDQCERECSGWA